MIDDKAEEKELDIRKMVFGEVIGLKSKPVPIYEWPEGQT